MFGLELKPGTAHRIAPFPELCLRLTNVVLVSPPKNARARVVLELCENPEQPNKPDDNHVAIAVLRQDVDNVPLSIFINCSMGLRISGDNCEGAVVHVTGTKFTPEDDDDDFADSPITLTDYLNMNSHLRSKMGNGEADEDDEDEEDEDYLVVEEDDESDSGDEDDVYDEGINEEELQMDDDDDVDAEELVNKIKDAVRKNKQLKGRHIDGDEDEDDKDVKETVKDTKKQTKKASQSQSQSQSPQAGKTGVKKAESSPKVKEQKRKLIQPLDEATRKIAKRATSIVKHPSGLQFQDYIVGVGKPVRTGHNVALQYTLRLESGKVVDKADRKRPFKFRVGVNECIKGFDIGVKDMREGGERHLIVPPELGYGDQRMADIPANSTLYFDITILKTF